MRLGTVLSPETDQDDFAVAVSDRNDGRPVGDPVLAEQPPALQHVTVDESGHPMDPVVSGTRHD